MEKPSTMERGPEVFILFNGFSVKKKDASTMANCTCTLIKGQKNVIVDTMTAWDGKRIKRALKLHNLRCNDIDYVVCTHGHSDHIGCNYLFRKAIHIVGHCVSKYEIYFDHNFEERVFKIADGIEVMATPGHTMQDVSVIVTTKIGIIAITGDLFERQADLKKSCIWKSAGSDDMKLQEENRAKMLSLADYIVPGHGHMFKVKKGSKSKKGIELKNVKSYKGDKPDLETQENEENEMKEN